MRFRILQRTSLVGIRFQTTGAYTYRIIDETDLFIRFILENNEKNHEFQHYTIKEAKELFKSGIWKIIK